MNANEAFPPPDRATLGPVQRHAYQTLQELVSDYDVDVLTGTWIDDFPQVETTRRSVNPPLRVMPTRGITLAVAFLVDDAMIVRVGPNVYQGFNEAQRSEAEYDLGDMLDDVDDTLKSVVAGGFTEDLNGRRHHWSFHSPSGSTRSAEIRISRTETKALRQTVAGSPPPWKKRNT